MSLSICDAGKHDLGSWIREKCPYCEIIRLKHLLNSGRSLMPLDCTARYEWRYKTDTNPFLPIGNNIDIGDRT